MHRKEFLTTLLLGLASSGLDAKTLFDPYSKEILLGKGKPLLSKVENPLLQHVQKAFDQMAAAAQKENIALKVVSGYRSFDRQASIWNRKYEANATAGLKPKENIQKIISYSTLPGTSRHHWGTEIDVIDAGPKAEGDVLVASKFEGDGPYAKLFGWMQRNAADFGFILPYTKTLNRKGFAYEPWHYSYAPLAIPMLNAYLKLDLRRVLKTSNVMGNEHFTSTFIDTYIKENIKGINPKLLQII